MRRLAIGVLLLAACGKKDPPPQPGPAPQPKPVAGAAVLELLEENEDSLDGPFEWQGGRSAALPDPLPADARIVLLHTRVYRGKARSGRDVSVHAGGAELTIAAPARPGARVGGGVRASMEHALSFVRVWPGDLAISRDGDAVVVRGVRVAPGETAVIFEDSARTRVLEDYVDDRSGEPKLDRRDLGEHTFRTRVTVRHTGVR